MPEKRLKTTQFNLRLAPELKAAGEEAAEQDNRSLSALLEKLLMDHCRKKGLWPPRDK
jgi:hypothetical protein